MPLSLDRCGTLGGDVEMVPTLKLLAERHPDVDFIIIGRNSGDRPEDVDLPGNIYNPWTGWQPLLRERLNAARLNYSNLRVEDHVRVAEILHEVTGPEFLNLDGVVMWLGQHGTTNQPLPSIRDRSKLTKPHDWSTLYCSYLLNGINAWRDVDPAHREEVLLNADPRNYPKYRDGKWPHRHPVLGQYSAVNAVKHERYGDGLGWHQWYDLHGNRLPTEPDELWESKIYTTYARLEVSALVPGTPYGDTIKFSDDFDRPHDFGIVINETRREVNAARSRLSAMKEWVLPLSPGFTRGKWSDQSLRQLGVDIQPVPQLEYISLLQSARCTLTTPSSGSGWATLKPWECFAAGTVCFFHPAYDDQDNILGDAPIALREFLRVKTPEQLRERVKKITEFEGMWHWAVLEQRAHFERAVAERCWLKLIEERLGL